MPVSAGVVRSKFSTRKKATLNSRLSETKAPTASTASTARMLMARRRLRFRMISALGYAALAFGRGGVVPGFLRVDLLGGALAARRGFFRRLLAWGARFFQPHTAAHAAFGSLRIGAAHGFLPAAALVFDPWAAPFQYIFIGACRLPYGAVAATGRRGCRPLRLL